ncbi:MAG: VPLPA-CTERM sorting domain-containing protein [Pseudomonadota bacterium]
MSQYPSFSQARLPILAAAILLPASALLATPAQAVTGTFTFLNDPDEYEIFTSRNFIDSTGEIGVTVTGGIYDSQGGGYPNAPLPGVQFGDVVGFGDKGLSIDNSALFSNGTDGSHQLDGNGARDFMRFTFTVPVTLVNLTLTYIGDDDNFDFGIDGVDVAVNATLGTDLASSFTQADNTPFDVPNHSLDYFIDFENSPPLANTPGNPVIPPGFIFDFYTNAHDDDYKIASMTVSFEDPNIITQVPLPGTAVLLLGAIGALAARRRLA